MSQWTARITVFNWKENVYKDWFVAVQIDKAYRGFENAYSFNSTKLEGPGVLNKTIFMQGVPGQNYLVPMSDGKDQSTDPSVPGKQQSVISFAKKGTRRINVAKGIGFPARVFFNGGECSLPEALPKKSGAPPPPPHRSISHLVIALHTVIIRVLQSI